MNELKARLDNLMDRIQENNPNANWKNLLTGVVILLLVAVFSIWYFGQTPQGRDSLVDTLNSLSERTETETTDGDGESLPVQTAGVGETVVLEGEGLWQVAERVCGNGEAYNFLAEANGLNIWSNIAQDQILVIDCGPASAVQ